MKNSLFRPLSVLAMVFVAVASNPSSASADVILQVSDTVDCLISDSGDHTLFQDKNGVPTEVEFKGAIKKANGKAATAKKNFDNAVAAGVNKNKKAKLKAKKDDAKRFAANLKKCQAGTLTEDDIKTPSGGGGSASLRSEVAMTAVGTAEPNGVTCQLSTGVSPKLSVEYGFAEFTSTEVVGIIGCRTNDGSAFDSVGIPSTNGYIQGFLNKGSGASPITGFSQTEIAKTASVFVQQICGTATACNDIAGVHASHKSGSPSQITFELTLDRVKKGVAFTGQFGGKGKSY